MKFHMHPHSILKCYIRERSRPGFGKKARGGFKTVLRRGTGQASESKPVQAPSVILLGFAQPAAVTESLHLASQKKKQ